MFYVKSSRKIFHANQIKIFDERIANSYPYVVRSTRNNGIRGYIIENENFLNPANTLSFAQDTFSVFYQKEPYFTGNKVKVLISKFKEFNPKVAIFMSGICQKVLESFTWGVGSTEDSIKKILISLPVYENSKIAFDYMEKYIQELEQERIQELEQERIQELEAYLLVAGLKDTKLSEKEQEALRIFAKLHATNGGGGESLNSTLRLEKPCHIEPLGEISPNINNKDTSLSAKVQYDNFKGISWKEFKLGELFEIKPTKAYKMTNATLFETKGNVPVVTNSSLNNGVSGYVALEPTEKGNMITYSDTTTSEGIFYQPRDFIGYSHIQGLYPLVFKDKWNRYSLLYIVSVFRKASFGRFDYGNKFNRNIAKELKISLPVYHSAKICPSEPVSCHIEPLGEVSHILNNRDFSGFCPQNDKLRDREDKNNKLAFDFMETFIKALQKKSIEKVVEFGEVKIKAYKNIVSKD